MLPLTSAFLSILLTLNMFLLFSKSLCFTILLRKNIKIMSMLVIRIFHICVLVTCVFHVWLYLILTNSCQSFSIFHWNLNSISAHNFIKISLSKTYIATHKLDVVLLSETYLDYNISNVDDNLEIPGYDLPV